jgi:glucosyl-dolichyl phosphate glucuronosyltransferase
MAPFDIVVCTISPPELFPNLQNLVSQSSKMDTTITIVVNGSKQSLEAWASFTPKNPNTQILFSDPFNLSAARNKGWLSSKSKWIFFIDDDAIPAPDLLVNIERVVREIPEECVIVGGAIDLKSDRKIPNLVRGYLSALDYGYDTKLLNTEFVNGAIFGARASFLGSVGGFSTSLGRQAGTLLSGEDSLLIYQARLSGKEVYYSGSLRVTQVVPEERLRLSFLIKRIFWEEVTQSIIRTKMGWTTRNALASKVFSKSWHVLLLRLVARGLRKTLG